MRGYVLVGGWPGSGKTTLSVGLAAALGFDYLSKDEVKEALMDQLGRPDSVDESQGLGRAAVVAVLRVARACRAAVIDSTWYPYTIPLVDALSGPFVEIRCEVPLELARSRYCARHRDARHLDAQRTEAELWGQPVLPLGVGPLITVDTSAPVDARDLAREVLAQLAALPLDPASRWRPAGWHAQLFNGIDDTEWEGDRRLLDDDVRDPWAAQ